MLPACLTIQYGSVISKFLLPSSSDLLNQLVRREFMLDDNLQLGLMINQSVKEGERVENAPNGSIEMAKYDAVVVPMDIGILQQLANDNVFHLRIYPSESVSQSNGNQVAAILSTVVAQYDFKGASHSELTFVTGDLIHVEYQYSKEWTKGRILSKTGQFLSPSGFFPSAYVSKLPPFSEQLNVDSTAVALEKCNYQDEEYFEGYSNLSIHLEMLQDTSRTLAFKNAVAQAAEFIKDKIVLDIGCGSGVLSLFCANAGAKHVYAIDASSVIDHARAVVEENNLSDKITLIKGKIEEIQLPIKKVDVIISEWMGTLLICESMIASVLWARATYLSPRGLMMPSQGNIYLAPLDLTEYYNSKIGYWDDVYGIKMSCLKSQAIKDFFSKPIFDRIIADSECLCDGAMIYSIDMHKSDEACLENMAGEFEFTVEKTTTVHGFGGWFDNEFISNPEETESPKTVLSTSPKSTPTHWRQVTFILENPLSVKKDDVIRGSMQIRRQAFWRRHFEVELRFSLGEDSESVVQLFPLWR